MDKIGIIGLGYVGLPLAVEFGKVMDVIGFDINKDRIGQLKSGYDKTRELTSAELQEASMLRYTSDAADLREANIFIVTVPTPVDKHHQPDLSPIVSATHTVAGILKANDIVIYESTVYPGCTEEVCVPILESGSGLRFNQDFFCGYSPERINPGDKTHRVSTILKVTSGSTPEIGKRINELYQRIIKAGTYLASSIKVAEAAKVIENSQRDINIAFVNELALIFERMGIDTHEVLQAAGTKWNFLPFRPGLVGGHCIGVDPYYLTYKAEGLGYRPEVILAGRRINDNMGAHIANRVIKLMVQHDHVIKGGKVLILGLTFKENCPDIRNSRVVDVIRELESFGTEVDVYDPHADPAEVLHEYGIELTPRLEKSYAAIVLAVSHEEFRNLPWSAIRSPKTIVFDVKGFMPRDQVSERL
ncbi:MAG: nucleotide sugar dehydrogenase [Cyclobacteriaceae bacterium]|jgi:UDP-N-acetyl-D-galactosamine dehydrogenase|nr:nucleotide sugar dehydrogenase [Cyclobacteriaceae bacterium]